MKKIDKILLKLHYRARREAIQELLKEFRKDEKIVNSLKELQQNESLVLTR